MPRPPSLFRPKVRANWTFVNRTKPIALFEASLATLTPTSTELLVFWGVGGQGKTKLCEELIRRLKAREGKAIKVAHVNLKKKDVLDPRLALVWIRNALAMTGGLSFPAFDLGYGLYWQAKNPEQALPAFEGVAWLDAGDQIVAEGLTSGVGAAVKAVAEHAIEELPFVGSAIKKLGTWAIKAARKRYTIKTNEAVKALYGPGGELLPVPDLERQLAALLAADLEQAALKNPDLRFVVLVDEYERGIENGGLTSRLRRSAFDMHVSRFAASAPCMLLTIFSRERLPWPDQPPEGVDGAAWTSWVNSAHHPLEGLSVKDAEHFLEAIPVGDREVRLAMIDGASVGPLSEDSVVYPLMLDLQVDIYLGNLVDGKLTINAESFRTAASSFEDLRRQLVERLLRDYPDAEGALKRLAVARSFNSEIFVHLEKEFLTGLSADEFEQLADLSFVRETEDGELAMHRIIRESLLERLSEDDQNATHQSLARFFEARAQLAPGEPLTPAHVSALSEAVYHRLEDDAASAARWWLEVRAPYFMRSEVGALVEIEQRLIDALSERAPREMALRLDLIRADVAELRSIGQVSDAIELNAVAIELARRLGQSKLTVLLEAMLAQAELLQNGNRFLEAEMLTDEVGDATKGLDPATFGELAQDVLVVIAEGLAARGLHTKAEAALRSWLAAAGEKAQDVQRDRLEAVLTTRLYLCRSLLHQDRIREADAEAAELESLVDADHSLSTTRKLLAYGTIARMYLHAGLPEAGRRVAAKAISTFKNAARPSDPLETADFLHVRSNLQSLLGAKDEAMRDALDWLGIVESSAAHGDADLIAPLFAVMRCALEAEDVAVCESTLTRIEDTAGGTAALLARQQYELLNVRAWLARAKAIAAGDTSGTWRLKVRVLAEEINRLGGTQVVLEQLQRDERDVRESLGSDHESHGIVLLRLAEQYFRCTDPENALKNAKAALANLEPKVGEQHPEIAAAIAVMLGAHLLLGEVEAAAPWAARLERLIGDAGPDMPWMAKTRTYTMLAEFRLAEEKWADATKLYELGRDCVPVELAGSNVSQMFDMLIAITAALSSGESDARWETLAPFAVSALGLRHGITLVAQRFLCRHLRDAKHYERASEAQVTLASIVHAMFGSESLQAREVFFETCDTWIDAGDYAKAEMWGSKALRGFTANADTRIWWAESLAQMATIKLRRGRVSEALADAAAIREDAAKNGPASESALVDAISISARAALIKGDQAVGLSITRELEAHASTLPSGDTLVLLWRRLALLHTLLGRHEDVARAAAEARRLARQIWSTVTWLEAEINLFEAVSAVVTKSPLPGDVSVWRISEWLGTLRESSTLNSPLLAEHQIRAAAAAEAMSEPELAISMLRAGVDAIAKSCGEFHPDFRTAERSLARLLAAAGS